ncbi:MAG: hypothetical protein PHW82_13955 [Bacteroidales bacterium]|nr:hypothetical protein [Bacteroidales bacterium]
MGKQPASSKSAVRVSAQDLEIFRLVTEEGMKYEEVAEQYEICDATVGRTVKRVRAYLKDLRDLQLGTNAETKTEPAQIVAAQDPPQERQLIPRAGENILDQVTDFAKVTHASASAGVVVGCATDSIIDGLTNPELSDEEGLRKTATGFASIGGFIYGSLKASQRLRENHPPRRED